MDNSSHYRFEASQIFSNQLFSVGSQMTVRMRLTDPEQTAFCIGFQSVVDPADIGYGQTAYSPQIDAVNATSANHDVFQMRFSLNACKFESPHINHPAHQKRKGSQRVIMDCALPVENFAADEKLSAPNDKLSSASSDSFSDDATTAEDIDEKMGSWHNLTIRWLTDKVIFLLDGKVYRTYSQP